MSKNVSPDMWNFVAAAFSLRWLAQPKGCGYHQQLNVYFTR